MNCSCLPNWDPGVRCSDCSGSGVTPQFGRWRLRNRYGGGGGPLGTPDRKARLGLALAQLRHPSGWSAGTARDLAEERVGAQVAEITALLDLASWPKGTQVLVRRVEPPPGASYALFDPHGLRYQTLITNSKDSDIAHLEARHGLHARMEHRIKETKWPATEAHSRARACPVDWRFTRADFERRLHELAA